MADRLDFFISFGGPDEPWAEWMAHVLEGEGYSVLTQGRDMRPGGNIVHQTQLGVMADRTILVLSPDLFDRDFPASEWYSVFFQDPVGRLRKLVPVLVSDCELPGLLAPIVYIKLLDLPPDKAREVFLDGLKPGRDVPKTPPPYPGVTA
ncbi:MAG TPA: toll/interleukin-1 receptor domain-containing protein [Umezawaea sp.]|nr:toll/interleukin-1 receptor domain-containing protein [Umezawaea sp.]